MRSTASGALVFLIGAFLLIPAVSGVILSAGDVTIPAPGLNASVAVIIDEVPDGLSGYGISVSLSNPGVAEITGIEFPDWVTFHTNSSLPAGSVQIQGVDFYDEISPGATDLTIATLILHGDAPGITPINLSTWMISAEGGNYPAPGLSNGTLTVAGGPATGEILLHAGWNFVSTPLTLAEGHRTVLDVFGTVDTGSHSLFQYNPSLRTWRQVMGADPIQQLDAVWIFSVSEMNVPLVFADTQEPRPTKELVPGWNMIGFSSTTPVSVRDTLTSVSDHWTTAIGFDAAAQHYETSMINGGSGAHGDTNLMYPSKGYWLFMTGNGVLQAISG